MPPEGFEFPDDFPHVYTYIYTHTHVYVYTHPRESESYLFRRNGSGTVFVLRFLPRRATLILFLSWICRAAAAGGGDCSSERKRAQEQRFIMRRWDFGGEIYCGLSFCGRDRAALRELLCACWWRRGNGSKESGLVIKEDVKSVRVWGKGCYRSRV